MTIAIGIVMDPIESITIRKDSTFAMMLETQSRGWDLWYMQQRDLHLRDDRCYARMRRIEVEENPRRWHRIVNERHAPLDGLDVVIVEHVQPVVHLWFVAAGRRLRQLWMGATTASFTASRIRAVRLLVFTGQGHRQGV